MKKWKMSPILRTFKDLDQAQCKPFQRTISLNEQDLMVVTNKIEIEADFSKQLRR